MKSTGSPHKQPVGSLRGGVCRGCGTETTLRKLANRLWACRDCGHFNRGYFPSGVAKKRRIPDEAVTLYVQGWSTPKIAAHLGFSTPAIVKRIRRAGVPIRHNQQLRGKPQKRPNMIVVPEDLLAQYGDLSISDIARRVGCSRATVTKALRARGVDTAQACHRRSRLVGYQPKAIDISRSWAALERAEKAVELRGEGLLWKQIAFQFGSKAERLITLVGTYQRGELLVQRLGLVEAR